MTSAHGDIRHLEILTRAVLVGSWAHGDIRHLENSWLIAHLSKCAHGDIRHLEIYIFLSF